MSRPAPVAEMIRWVRKDFPPNEPWCMSPGERAQDHGVRLSQGTVLTLVIMFAV
jgi:hypothetical protein